MPGFDRTGPVGAGPLTGGRRGVCNPSRAHAGYDYGLCRNSRRVGRRNFSGCRGRGSRDGWQEAYPYTARHYVPVYSVSNAGPYALKPEEEADMLKNELNALKKRIEALESLSPDS